MKYDIAIIGGGPAGLSAAITASSKGRKVVVFEAHGFSPRLRSVELITDYMGCPDISGNELMDRFIEHARHIGAEIIEEKIVSLKEKAGYFELGTPNSQYNADTVILATGISRSSLLPGEKEFLGRGVSYCAKVDGAEYKGVKVYSLYGAARRPAPAMLDSIDVMTVDIQDVGARHYTYVSTMAYAMEECAKAGKKFVVFDRPNPIGGLMEGPLLRQEQASFIGLYPVPLRHGLTIGEYARYINDTQKLGLDLTVIPMKGWQRKMYWQDTGLPWVGTSPQIPTAATALYYVTTGILGDTNLSVGIGTTKPFYYVGAPFAEKDAVADKLNSLQLPGVYFRPAAFIPAYGAFAKELCQGVEIYITDAEIYRAALTGANILRCIEELYPDKVVYPARYGGKGYKIDIALGETALRVGVPLERLLPRWDREAQEFAEQVRPYLLYK